MTDELILENFLPYRLAVLSHTISTTIAQVYEERFSLSIPEWRVIAILGRYPGLSAVEVAERTVMDKVAVSRAVTKLLKNGRIDGSLQMRIADAQSSICPKKGRRVHDEVAPLALQFERDLLQGLDDDDTAKLDVIMDASFGARACAGQGLIRLFACCRSRCERATTPERIRYPAPSSEMAPRTSRLYRVDDR